MKSKTRLIFSTLLLVFVFVLAACQGQDKTFTVTFNADGGTPVPEVQKVKSGKLATEPSEEPTKDGFSFDGWFLGEEKYVFSTPVEEDITLKAGWSQFIDSAEVAAMDALKDYYSETIGIIGFKITEDVELKQEIEGFTITWTSNNPDVFSNTGVVNRPLYADGDESIILEAKISNNVKHNFRFIVEKQEQTVAEKIDDALDLVTSVPASSTGFQETNFLAVPTVTIDGVSVAVTWVTSDATAMKANGELVQFEDDSQKEVTLTATITYQGLTKSKEIVFLVKGVTAYDNFSEALIPDNVAKKIKINGVAVYGDLDEGYYLISADGSLAYIHSLRSNTTTPKNKLFDVIVTVDNYYNAYQLKNVSVSNIHEGTLPEAAYPVKTINDIVTMEKPSASSIFNHISFRMENVKVHYDPTLRLKGTDKDKYDTFLVDPSFDPATDQITNENAVMIYYLSEIDVLKALDGKTINYIDLVMYGYRDDTTPDLWYASFFDFGDDIDVVLTDEEKAQNIANLYKNMLDYNYYKTTDITLVTEKDGATIAWSTDDDDVFDIANKKIVVDAGLTTQKEVSLTYVVTYNQVTVSTTITTIVGPLEVETTEDVIGYTGTSKRWFKVKVIVVGKIGNNSYALMDDKGAIATYSATKLDIGYEYTLVGSRVVFNGLIQIEKLDTVVKGDAKALPTPDVIVEADLDDMLPYQSHLVTIMGVEVTAKAVDKYGTTDMTLKLGSKTIAFRWDNRVILTAEAKALLDSVSVGDRLNLVGAPLGWYNGPQIAYDTLGQIVLLEPAEDDDAVKSAINAIAVDSLVKEAKTLVLPTVGKFGSTIAWSSSNEAVISNAGVVTMPTANETVYLTATVSFGTATAEKVFSVYAQVDDTLLNVVLAKELAAGASAKVEGIVTGIYGTTYVYISDPNGDTLRLYSPVIADGLEIGDKVVVSGEMELRFDYIQMPAGATMTIKEKNKQVPAILELDKIPEFSVADQGRRYSFDTLYVVSVSGRNLILTDGDEEVVAFVDPYDADVVAHIAAAVLKKVSLVNIHLGWHTTGPQFLIHDISQVVVAELSEAEVAERDLAEIKLEAIISEAGDLNLPSKGARNSSFVWSSSNTDVITDAGVVTLPTEAIDVILTASVVVGQNTYTREFKVKVLKPSEAVLLATYDFTLLTEKKGTEMKTQEAFLTMLGKTTTDTLRPTLVENLSKVYEGNAAGGGEFEQKPGVIKTGTSSLDGTMKLTFDVEITKIVITLRGWGASDNITVNGIEETAPVAMGTLTFTFAEATQVLDFLFEKRVLITKIQIYGIAD